MLITEKKLKIYDRIIATVSALGLIIGGLWTLNGFIDVKTKETKLHQDEINLGIYNEKKAIYYELIDAEAEIASCNTYEEVNKAQKVFRKLYVGRGHIIGQLDTAVSDQKIRFGDLLDTYLKERPNERPFDYFGASSLELVEICKKYLKVDPIN